jgi:hypothetical protein
MEIGQPVRRIVVHPIIKPKEVPIPIKPREPVPVKVNFSYIRGES